MAWLRRTRPANRLILAAAALALAASVEYPALLVMTELRGRRHGVQAKSPTWAILSEPSQTTTRHGTRARRQATRLPASVPVLPHIGSCRCPVQQPYPRASPPSVGVCAPKPQVGRGGAGPPKPKKR